MNSAIPVDTLAITRQLVDAGFDRIQAETVATVLRDANLNLVTRDDLRSAVGPLATRAELYKALGLQFGGFVAVVGMLFALLTRFI